MHHGAPLIACDLSRATRVGRSHDVDVEAIDALGFGAPERRRRLWLREVVDASGATTGVAVGHLEQGELRDGAQEPPRLGSNALAVREVAGVVVGDPKRERVPGRPRRELVEQLVHITDTR